MLDPGKVGVPGRRGAVLPAFVVFEQVAAPVAVVKGRIGQDIVGLEIGVQVAVEAVGMFLAEVVLDLPYRQVHLGQPPGGVVGLLTEDADVGLGLATVAVAAGVGLHELDRLDKHAARAATGVIDPAFVRREHLDQHAHDAPGRIELAALLALGAGELGEEVLVHAAENILGAVLLVPQADVSDHVDELAEPLLVEARVGVVFGQHAFEGRVVALDGEHGLIDGLADGGLLGVGLEVGPAGFFRDPKDVDGAVLVRVFRVGSLGAFGIELGMLLLESVGDVLEEDQAKHDMLVLGGVHVGAERVGGAP